MDNIINAKAIHYNGKPELQIGLGSNSFTIEYNKNMNAIVFSSQGEVLHTFNVNNSILNDSTVFKFRGVYKTYSELLNATPSLSLDSGYAYTIISAGGTDAVGQAITEYCVVAYYNGNWYKVEK